MSSIRNLFMHSAPPPTQTFSFEPNSMFAGVCGSSLRQSFRRKVVSCVFGLPVFQFIGQRATGILGMLFLVCSPAAFLCLLPHVSSGSGLQHSAEDDELGTIKIWFLPGV